MKKLLGLLSLLLIAPSVYAAKIAVTVGTGALQPGTTAGFNVTSGTVQNLTNVNQASSGTYTINGSTFSFFAGVSTGTRFERSTVTFQGGEFSGTRNDNSTTTWIGGGNSGTRNDSSTTTFLGGEFSGTRNDNSTTTLIGAVRNGTAVDNATTTWTGTQRFRNVVAISTGMSQAAIFSVDQTSVTVGRSGANGTIFGTQTNDAAAAGQVGELINAQGARSNGAHGAANTPVSITTITLTAGDWDIRGAVGWRTVGTTTLFYAAINTSPNALPGGDFYTNFTGGAGIIPMEGVSIASSKDFGISLPTSRISLGITTNVYLVEQSDQANTIYGYIEARRMR